MRARSIDAWLVYDFRGSSAVLARLLPPAEGAKRWTTRRVLLLIPSHGEPRVLVHGIDASQFQREPIAQDVYLAWPDLHAWIARAIATCGTRIAMDYSPGGALPVVSQCDAGIVDLVRGLGAEVVTSADLIQTCIARWSPSAVKSHEYASREVARIKDEAFALIRDRLRAKASVNEREVQQHILAQFDKAGLIAADAPVVAVNGHAADPHFEVPHPPAGSANITPGDWILIDLWARQKGTPEIPEEENIFSDITWVGFAGEPSRLPARHREVFETVKKARDASVARVQQGYARGEHVQGWQLDDAARDVIVAAGFAEFIRHRTGHSLSAGPLVHGLGVNLDNLETRDTREVLPGVGWTIEPGIYIPGAFGVRLEINMFNDPARGPVITSCIQNEIVWCG